MSTLDVREAIRQIVAQHPRSSVVSTCGYVTRDLFDVADRPNNFYLVGSMGMAAPIGLGVAVAHPDRRVVVLDGDGSFAMNLSCLPVIAQQRPDLVHVVLDNGLHESTGGQRTVPTDPVELALAAGYPAAHRVGTATELQRVRVDATPALVHVRCAPRRTAAGRRVEHTPQRLVARFRNFLIGGST